VQNYIDTVNDLAVIAAAAAAAAADVLGRYQQKLVFTQHDMSV